MALILATGTIAVASSSVNLTNAHVSTKNLATHTFERKLYDYMHNFPRIHFSCIPPFRDTFLLFPFDLPIQSDTSFDIRTTMMDN